MNANYLARISGRGLLAASILLVSQAFGGYVYEFSQSGKAAKGDAARILVDGSKIKMTGFDEGAGEVIFDGKSQEMTVVNHKEKSYFELDREAIEEMSAKIGGAMAEMEAQLAKMPPAQREMMEKMMKDKMPGQAKKLPEPTIKRTGESDTVAGYEAERVDLLTPAGETHELWIVPWDELKGSEGISDAFTGMSQLFDKMMSAFSQGPMGGMISEQMKTGWLDQMHSLGGFPVKTRELNRAGKVVSETALEGVDERELAASEFKAPKGYKRQKMKM